MRIVIDMQGAQSDSRYRGIGRYSFSFIKALVQQGSQHEFFLVLNGDLPESVISIREAFRNLLPQSNIVLWQQPAPRSERDGHNKWLRRSSELIREALILSLNPDVVHVTSFFEGYVDSSVISISWLQERGISISVSLYDLIPLLSSHQYLDPEPKYKAYYMAQIDAFKKADLFLGISQFTCQQAIDHLELDPLKVFNISAAVSEEFGGAKNDLLDRRELLGDLGIKKEFILCVGGGDPRKNISNLVAAYTALDKVLQDRYDLILVGPNIHHQDIEASSPIGFSNQIHVLGHLTDEDLIVLYQSCSLFVFPSLFEGFGLPPLEAMSCGAPVISSNATSLPEVVGLDDALFDATSIPQIAEKITQALLDEDLRKLLVEHGKKQAAGFTWYDTAKKALIALEGLARSERNSSSKLDLQPDEIYRSLLSQIASIPSSIGRPNENEVILCAKSIADTFPKKQAMPRIFVDISELAQRDSKTGIQRVTRSILYELLINPPHGYVIEPIYGTIEKIGYRFAREFTRKLLGKTESIAGDDFIDPQQGDIFLGLDLQHHTTRVQRDYLQGMRRMGVPVYFVVYDLLPIQFPQFWPAEHQVDKVHEEWLTVVCEGDGALCISKAVADELGEWMNKTLPPKPNFQISWFHLGADLQGSLPTFGLPEDAGRVLENLSRRDSFLLVGTLEPRKGYSQVLEAFEILWSDSVDVNLVIVGKKGWVVDGLLSKLESHAELGKRLFWLQGVSDEYLGKVYEASTCLIAASEGEGFGLPLIEAAQHEIPIIARDLPVFNEVAGEGAYYFHGSSGKSLSEAIVTWRELNQQGKAPVSSKLLWMTWKESAHMLFERLLTLATK